MKSFLPYLFLLQSGGILYHKTHCCWGKNRGISIFILKKQCTEFAMHTQSVSISFILPIEPIHTYGLTWYNRQGASCSANGQQIPAVWTDRFLAMDRMRLSCGQASQMPPFLFDMGAFLLEMRPFVLYNAAISRRCPWLKAFCSRGTSCLDAEGCQLVHK